MIVHQLCDKEMCKEPIRINNFVMDTIVFFLYIFVIHVLILLFVLCINFHSDLIY